MLKVNTRSGLIDNVSAILNERSTRVALVLILVGLLFGYSARAQAQIPPTPPDKVKGISDVLYPPTDTEQTIGAAKVTSEEAILGIKVPILMYHYIEINPNPTGDPGRSRLLVTPANFEAQLKYLRDNGWTTVTLDDLISYFANPQLMPAKPVILTFDDGYQDFYDNAWPLLKKYHDKATIYVISLGGHPGACGNNFWQPNFYMTDAELRELASTTLITVGAHTEDHCSLKGKPEATQWQEILGSKTELEAIIGKPVRDFAYPYGSFDQTTLRIVKESGFDTAVTTIPGSVNNESMVYTLHRVRMANLPVSWFADQLAK